MSTRAIICKIENRKVLITHQAAISMLDKKNISTIHYEKENLENKIKICEKYLAKIDLKQQREGILIYGD